MRDAVGSSPAIDYSRVAYFYQLITVFFFFFFLVLCTSKHSSTFEDPVDAVQTSIWNNKGVFRDLLANNDARFVLDLPWYQ